ncbi:lipocalin-like domain-containing protein [Larkinella soli]|uniref:lipocalin family protein n=1 Tax=Larkinella soli TaxID=1770527 RepID=UPI000FFB7CA2|nr:lipocalin family protein [Larkinella soli]
MKPISLFFSIPALLLVLCAGFRPSAAPDITGSWRMTAHRVSPAQNGVEDIYTHFKDLYGGCSEDMGVTLNADGTVTMRPVKGCQNPLGNVIMKAVARFMPSGKTTWSVNGDKVLMKDHKGNQQEYDLIVEGQTMKWLFDTKDKDTTVKHTVEFQKE